MKLEYIADAFEGEGLLLLYSGGPREVDRLRDTVQTLSVPGTHISLHDLDFIEAVADCEVTASSVATSRGVHRSGRPLEFVWSLSPSDWEQVHGLLEPFSDSLQGPGTHFQYLHEHGGIEVIYSTSRGW